MCYEIVLEPGEKLCCGDQQQQFFSQSEWAPVHLWTKDVRCHTAWIVYRR